MSAEVRKGDVWKDRDKRGGPTFVVLDVNTIAPFGSLVENVNGPKRRRFILTDRIPRSYRLVSREATDE